MAFLAVTPQSSPRLDHSRHELLEGLLGVEAVLLCSNPSTHIDSQRPIVRVVMRDALERLGPYDGLIRRYAQPFTPARHEARALATLGAGKEMLPTLGRFAGLPEPMDEAVAIAEQIMAELPTEPGARLPMMRPTAAIANIVHGFLSPPDARLPIAADILDAQTSAGQIGGRVPQNIPGGGVRPRRAGLRSP